MNPTFSIIIPVYNVAPYLRECLDSVLAQTFTDWEAICVDDGSTDGSGTILDEYAAKDGRFRVVHQKNSGVSVARQVALELCQGEWIAAVDSDDWLDSDYYGKMIGVADANQVDMVWSGFTKECNHGLSVVRMNKAPCDFRGQVLALLDGSLWGGLCMRLIRNTFVRRHRLGFNMRNVSVCEDLCFVIEALVAGARTQYVDSAGYHYRMWSGSSLHKGCSTNSYLSLMSVANYLENLSRVDWMKDAALRWRKDRLMGPYLERTIPDDVFLNNNGGCKDLWGTDVPVHHKVMYWLAVRGLRRFLIGFVSAIRGIRGLKIGTGQSLKTNEG